MGLDNPDTLYFGTRVHADRDYVVTGRRGTTTDLSFQLLGGEYTDDNVPASQAAFDDRELDIAEDGSFEWRVRPTSAGQLVMREVYGDWSAQRGTLAISPTGHRRHRAAAADSRNDRKALRHRRKAACQPGENLVVILPQWFYLDIPVNTMVAPTPDARGPGHAVLVGRALRPAARPSAGDHHPGFRCALPRVPAR